MDPFLHSPAEKPSMEEEPDRRKNPSRSKRPTSDSDDYEDERPRREKSSSKRKSDLLSPVKTTAKYGGKAIYKTASIIIRFVSLLLIAGTAAFLAYNFWRGSAPYGDPVTAVEEKNYCLAAYAGVAGFFLLFECISFLWAMTRVRVRDGRKTYKEDTGRGLFSFNFYLCVLLCILLDQPDHSTVSGCVKRNPRCSGCIRFHAQCPAWALSGGSHFLSGP